MPYKSLNIDFTPFFDKLKNFKITEINTFDSFLSDIADYVFDAIDNISETTSDLQPSDYKPAIAEFQLLQTQVANLSRVLYSINSAYDSHYMDRLLSVLGSLQEDLTNALKAFGN